MPASWALGSAPGAGGGLERATTGCSRDPVDTACWKSRDRVPKGPPTEARPRPARTHPPFQARAVPQFPCRAAARWLPGLVRPSPGRRGRAHTGSRAGWGEGPVLPLHLGGWPPGRPGLGGQFQKRFAGQV